jgi:DNA repair photolyase
MEIILRKSLLYKSGLGVYCINHVQGCSHGCNYPCYAFMMAQSYGRVLNYTDWCQPKLVTNACELLSKELARMKVKPDSIHLCLSTDPFMTGFPEVTDVSLKLIAIINSHGIRCSILTKGKLPSELADKGHFNENNLYGISLISLNEEFRNRWEPGTIPYTDRIAALRYLHDNGFRTLAHIEPYPTPNLAKQSVEDLLEAVNFVDRIHFSGWNYNNKIKQFDNYEQFYREQSMIVNSFCKERNIEYNC